MSCCTVTGTRASLPRLARPIALTPEQVIARRNAEWLFLAEIGLEDPATRRVRPRSVRQIAELCKVSVRTVQLGLASARRIRDQTRSA